MLHVQPMRHRPSEIAEIVIYTDGGGARVTKGTSRPATWAFIVLTKGKNGTIAFDRAIGGRVVTAPEEKGYIGAEQATSMTAEVSAQVHAMAFCLSDPLGGGTKPISIIFDNTTAAKFALSVAQSKKSKMLHAITGALGQILGQHTAVTWGHVYSHLNDGMNELADTIVAYVTFNSEARHCRPSPCSTW